MHAKNLGTLCQIFWLWCRPEDSLVLDVRGAVRCCDNNSAVGARIRSLNVVTRREEYVEALYE